MPPPSVHPYGDPPQQVIVRQTIGADPATVFALFTHHRHLEQWFCDEAQSDERLGGEVHAVWADDDGEGSHERVGHWVAWEPPHLAVVEWFGVQTAQDETKNTEKLPSDFWRVAIAPHPDGCMVTVVSPVLRSEGTVRPQVLYDSAKMGWEMVLQGMGDLIRSAEAKP